MTRNRSSLPAAAICLLAAACSNDPDTPHNVGDGRVGSGDEAVTIQSGSPLDGLWSGSWGGGAQDGVVMQPVLAGLLIDGDRAELAGFPEVGRLRGTLRTDADAGRIRIIPAVESDGPSPRHAVDFAYELQGDALTLTANDGRSIVLQRRHAVRDALANVPVEFVAASGISGAGDLLVTEFRMIRTGGEGAAWYEPHERALNARGATVLQVQESGVTEIGIDEARALISGSTPVAIVFRHDDRPPHEAQSEFLTQQGPVAPTDVAVRQTIGRLLRPGTLVFVLSASDNVPRP